MVGAVVVVDVATGAKLGPFTAGACPTWPNAPRDSSAVIAARAATANRLSMLVRRELFDQHIIQNSRRFV
jgi:hypothetical protein